VFGSTQTVLLDVWDEIVDLVYKETRDGENATDANCQEAEAYFAQVEVVNRRIYERENLEERVVDTISE